MEYLSPGRSRYSRRSTWGEGPVGLLLVGQGGASHPPSWTTNILKGEGVAPPSTPDVHLPYVHYRWQGSEVGGVSSLGGAMVRNILGQPWPRC